MVRGRKAAFFPDRANEKICQKPEILQDNDLVRFMVHVRVVKLAAANNLTRNSFCRDLDPFRAVIAEAHGYSLSAAEGLKRRVYEQFRTVVHIENGHRMAFGDG
jgi:hypothetical protein